jgi:hypothetical protein
MPKWLLLALVTGTLDAAVIRGVVVEHQTGKPLARALVVVQPVAGTPGATLSARTNPYGAFEFPPLAAGAYLVSASKRSFAPLQYGQKQWKSAGVPVILEEAATPFLSLRLQRFGAIAGVIADENDVGLPEHDVVVFRNTRPPQLAGRGRTDDRGMYRIGGLEPGSYVVRTIGKQYDEGGYVPTFSKETARLDEAHAVDVNLDQQVEDANVRPFPGQLFLVAGQAITSPPAQVTLTLISDMGSETTVSDAAGNFRFNPQAPGPYELYAQAQGNDRRGGGTTAGYRTLLLDRDRADNRINLGALPDVRFLFEDTKGQPVDLRKVQVLARRKDLSGDGATESYRPAPGTLKLLPGRWDLSVTPSASYYAASFSGPGNEGAQRGRADGWNEMVLAGPGPETVKFVLSPTPATVHGVVSDASHDPVTGVPVFLEAYDPDSRKRLMDVRVTRTDTQGRYQFYGLAPGAYRMLSSFEFQMPDSAALDAANARTVKLEEGRDLPVDLDQYMIR